MTTHFSDDSSWANLNEFVSAGGVTNQTEMRFRDACAHLRRSHNTSEGQFNRVLFRILKNACHCDSFSEVAERFHFTEAEVPVDETDDASEIGADMEAAQQEAGVAQQRLSAALARREAAAARLARIDTLKSELPALKESLAYVEGLSAEMEAEIQRMEKGIIVGVYELPKYTTYGNAVDFVLAKEQRIIAARSAIAAHAERVKVSRALVKSIEDEIQRLKRGRRKEHAQPTEEAAK